MCEYCGCQAVNAIDLLTREHDAAREHAYAAEIAAVAGNFRQAQEACRSLAAVLVPHTAVEEQALFPVMAREFGPQMHALVDDHRLIETVLSRMLRFGSPPEDWADPLLSALVVLREHILKEQDGVFPAALATLTPDEWDGLDAVRRAVGTSLTPV